MAGVGEETARIGEHADEPAQQAVVRQRVQLPLHRLLLVKEPPAAAKLHLAGHGTVLKVADHRGEDIVVRGIQIVEHGTRQFAGRVERVEITTERAGLGKIADGVEAGIGPEPSEQARVGAAQGAEMQLLGPAAGGIPAAQLQHQERAELRQSGGRGGPALTRGIKDRPRLGGGAGLGESRLDSVIGEAAAEGVKVVMTLFQRRQKIVEGFDRTQAGRARQLLQVGIERRRLVDQECLVRPEGRVNPCVDAGLSDAFMGFERVSRVVGRADDRDLVGRKDVVDAHRREFRIRLLPDFLRGRGIDDGLDPKVALQLEMRPMVERIAQRVRHGRTPRRMFFPG